MSVALKSPPPKPLIVYPDSDGKPMSDNTKQFRWIQVLQGNLAAKFRDDKNVFVAGDLLWYPVQGEPKIRIAPDALVVFGRPKGDRGSYKQWEEDDIAPQVVFEVLSPGNAHIEMMDKLDFYDEHGVEEYYLYDPELDSLRIRTRGVATLKPVWNVEEFVSPRLHIRFDLSGDELVVFHADGRRFLTFEQLEAEREREQKRAENEKQRADSAEQRADHAEKRLDETNQRLDETSQRLAASTRRMERIAELTRRLLAGQASDEDKAELTRLTSTA